MHANTLALAHFLSQKVTLMMVANIFQIIENSNEFRKSQNLVKSHGITCIACGKILRKFRVRRHVLCLETQIKEMSGFLNIVRDAVHETSSKFYHKLYM